MYICVYIFIYTYTYKDIHTYIYLCKYTHQDVYLVDERGYLTVWNWISEVDIFKSLLTFEFTTQNSWKADFEKFY